MEDKIKKMKKKELESEYQSVCEQIDFLSFGRWELAYREALEREISRRGYEVRSKHYLA